MVPTPRRLVLGLHRTRVDEYLLATAQDLGVKDLDTAYNYGGFTSLDQLAALQALSAFNVTSKVGFFQSRSAKSPAEHTLAPARLFSAIEDTVARLGAPLDVILLHNPEQAARRSLRDLPDSLAAAARTLQRAVRNGLACRWGLSIWQPGPLLEHLTDLNLQPDVLMTRVGFSVSPSEIAAIERCRGALAWPGIEYRGMAPLGGARAPSLLGATNLTSFVRGGATNAQAAIRASFELPPVSLVALGTSLPAHLRQAAEACAMEIDAERVSVYRDLVRTHGRDAGAPD